MSEYWVSHKKYFCKYCEIYIADDVPSRRQHENGLRHKGNRERFVRSLYKQGERRNKDLEEEKREMARIEAASPSSAANSSFARDVSTGHASLASSSSARASQASSSAVASKKPERPASMWSNYSTAQSLGITDPDEERVKAEMERRRTQGIVGEWEAVAPPPPPLSSDVQSPKEEPDSKDGVLKESLPQKREAEPLEDEEDGRYFKLRKRKIGVGLGEIWDPNEIPIKIRSKPREEDAAALLLGQAGAKNGPDESAANSCGPKPTSLGPTEGKPKWQPMGWKRVTVPAGATQADTNIEAGEQSESNGADLSIKNEDAPAPLHSESFPSQHLGNSAHQEIKSLNNGEMSAKLNAKEEEISSPAAPEQMDGLFKKRKVPARGRHK